MTDDDPSKAHAAIDENLRRAYDEVTKQDIPDRFKQLLSELRNQTGHGTSNVNQGPMDRAEDEGAYGED
ncbi:MAG: NepR family anti-sigma factor [Pseudomonadota bacterium]